MEIGINLASIAFWASAVPYTNLAIGEGWHLNWGPVADDVQDSDGRLFGGGPDKIYHRAIEVPTSVPDGYKVTCTWTGSGRVTVGAGPTLLSSSPGRITMALYRAPGHSRATAWLEAKGVERARPISNLDCRGNDSPAGARFRSGFVNAIRGYKVLRFMDWQNSNANLPVTWATRHTTAGINTNRDGVAIEDMIALANEIGADPWFVMPWNADDEYYRNFAKLVRDRLPDGHHVYVETGNEIWNTGFAAARQAQQEGLAEGLSKDPMTARMDRYAEKTIHVMSIWEKVFAGHPGLVRVASSQNAWSVPSAILMGYPRLADHIDALATAPYFGFTMGGTNISYQTVIDKTTEDLNQVMKQAALNRAIAQHYHKRYITYEGGQSVTLYADYDLLKKVEYSPDMYQLYKRYLGWWRKDNGDVIMLYNAISQIGRGMAWGQAEYETSTPADSPKLRAIVEERGH
ncbi:MAG: hypothetical protein KGK11_08005 [Sphingomonadales bacterium]|nr:hypothetical protein [Sphingomonadales bacterium]